eukprot:g31633.t1
MASLHRIHDASRSNDSGRAASLMLTFPVSAPAAAPCAAVAVRCGARGALASRVGSKWMASFPGLEGEHVTFHIEDLSLQFSNQSPGNAESESPVEAFASRCAEQSDLWDEELCFGKEARFEEARLVKRALQVSKLKEKPEVRGFALEQLKQDAEGLWQNLLFLAEALPEDFAFPATVCEEKFAFGWSRVCAAAVCLLAAALGKGDLILPLSDLEITLMWEPGHMACFCDMSCLFCPIPLCYFAFTKRLTLIQGSSAEDLYQVLMGSDVALSIYELHGTAAVTALTQLAGLGGAFHVGVQVYWLEWSFGWCQDGSGIQALRFGTSDLGRFRERLPLGRTPLAPEEERSGRSPVLAVLADMRKQWDGQSYDLLRRNCAHFSVDFVRRLRVEEAWWLGGNRNPKLGGLVAGWPGGLVSVVTQQMELNWTSSLQIFRHSPQAPEWINALATAGGQIAQWLGVFRPVLLQEPWALGLPQVCKRCAEMELSDPLEKYGMSAVELNKAVASLMGAPPSGAAAVTEASASLTPAKLLDGAACGIGRAFLRSLQDIHKFMLAEYERLASQSDKGSRDASIVSFAAQAIVAGKAEAKYKVSVEEIRIDIENAVLVHQGALTSNTEFAEVNVKMQKAIAKLMGI